LTASREAMLSQQFAADFHKLCQMDYIPEIDISYIKKVKVNFIDEILTNNPEGVARLGTAGRLLGSWIDGVIEFTILKHEVVVLRLKNKRVIDKI